MTNPIQEIEVRGFAPHLYFLVASPLYQFTKVLSHFRELKNKPSKVLRFPKWQRHFGDWY